MSGSARLHGKLPTVPRGVLTYAEQHGEDRITWQPEPGVRSATVVVPVRGRHPGFVLAGRSVRDLERREDTLSLLVSLGWLVTLGAVLLVVIAVNML